MRKLLLLGVLLAVLPVRAHQRPVRVSCVGNSITYGLTLENRERDSYPAQLQRMLGEGYQVENFGKSGATLLRHGHRPYVEQEEFRRALAFAGDIVVIHLGINDTDPRDWPLYSREFVEDYLALIDSLRNVNPRARILVARMTPIAQTHPRFWTGTKQYHGDIQRAIEDVIARSGAQMVDFYEPMYHYPWMLPDAVHPVPEGAALLAKAVYEAITGDFGGLAMPEWYSDNMVLPREKVFSIRGKADAGQKVTVRLAGKKYKAVTGTDGLWEVQAGPFPPMLSTELTVQAGKKKLCYKDVALGDIWLCSGQSNMEFTLQQSSTAQDAAAATDPGLRLLDSKCNWRTNDVAWSASAVDSVQRLQYFRPAAWTMAGPEPAARFSAVGYYFGRALRDSLQVPVGIICNAVGGSTTESWVNRELLETQYPEILKDWLNNPLIMEWARERARKNLSLGKGTRHPYEPCYNFESTILPLEDCPIEGVIWYQGESNAENIPAHEKLFPLLVDSWRGVFGPVPFYYAQLSFMNRPAWPAFRQSQAALTDCRKDLGMVSTLDLGLADEVHYPNKKPVGERFARLALTQHYGRPIDFDAHFEDATLRLDYVFSGDWNHQAIYLRKMLRTPAWAGRRAHLTRPLLQGNGQIRVLDPQTGECLYSNSFSSLFQEWTVTPEAKHTQKAFEGSFQVPYPRHPVQVEVSLKDVYGHTSARIVHPVDPKDILIRPLADNGLRREMVYVGGSPQEVIDIVILSEGYAAADEAKFFKDAGRAADALFSHEPFRSHRRKFAVRAVFAPSAESGVSVPGKGEWRSTATSSHFDTFYTDRYLTTSDVWQIADLIGTVPYEHIIVLANTDKYGGGGIYNSLTIMNSDHFTFVPVLVHEFGHAFGGLADEYAYASEGSDTMYPAGTEPWEPNITNLTDFASKWQDMLPEGVPVPTPVDDLDKQDVRRIWKSFTPEQKAQLNLKLGVYEGAGYEMYGVYRPVQECRMRINECEEFCPVCTRAIIRMIQYYTE